MITVEPMPTSWQGTCDACKSKPGSAVARIRGPAACFDLCERCRAELHRILADGLTVGAALALPEVQRGEAVVESSGHGRVQVGVVNQCVRVRCLLGGAWTEWETLDAYKPALLALPCRLVTLAAADADPATRGDL